MDVKLTIQGRGSRKELRQLESAGAPGVVITDFRIGLAPKRPKYSLDVQGSPAAMNAFLAHLHSDGFSEATKAAIREQTCVSAADSAPLSLRRFDLEEVESPLPLEEHRTFASGEGELKYVVLDVGSRHLLATLPMSSHPTHAQVVAGFLARHGLSGATVLGGGTMSVGPQQVSVADDASARFGPADPSMVKALLEEAIPRELPGRRATVHLREHHDRMTPHRVFAVP